MLWATGDCPRDLEVALEVMGVAWDAVQCSDLRGLPGDPDVALEVNGLCPGCDALL